MSRRLIRSLVAAAAALAFAVVPAADPASASTARVQEWVIRGEWSCALGCGDGSFALTGHSTTCGQNGADLDTAGAPRVAVDYACTASISGYPNGTCAAGVCAFTCCVFDVDITDPNNGTTLHFTPVVEGVLAREADSVVVVVHLVDDPIRTSPATVSYMEAVLTAAACLRCGVGTRTFVMTLTQVQAAP